MSSQIKITGIDTILNISNEKARKLAEDKKNMTLSEQRETWVEIGSWQGYLSKVSSILIENERSYKEPEDFGRPLTPEESKRKYEIMKPILDRVRSNLEAKGILKPLNFSTDEGKCKDCRCLLKRDYICRHTCKKCLDSNPLKMLSP